MCSLMSDVYQAKFNSGPPPPTYHERQTHQLLRRLNLEQGTFNGDSIPVIRPVFDKSAQPVGFRAHHLKKNFGGIIIIWYVSVRHQSISLTHQIDLPNS